MYVRSLVWLIQGDDVVLPLWRPATSKLPKLEHILSLKSTKERPVFKSFSSRYEAIMNYIQTGEEEVSQFKGLSQESDFGTKEVPLVFKTIQECLRTTLESLAGIFESELGEILKETDVTSEDKGILLNVIC